MANSFIKSVYLHPKPWGFFLALVCIILFSCKKNGDDTKVRGQVINGITLRNVPGAQLVIVEWEAQIDPKSRYKEIKFFETDFDGTFEIGFDVKRNRKYSYFIALKFDNKMYAEGFFSPEGKKLEKNAENNIDLYLYPGGIINVNFSPPPPYNTGDFISGKITHANTGKEFMVSSLDGNFSTGIISMGNYIVEIYNKKSGITDSLKEVIWLDKDEEKNYTIYH